MILFFTLYDQNTGTEYRIRQGRELKDICITTIEIRRKFNYYSRFFFFYINIILNWI